MSIKNLFEENNYDLFCRNLTSEGLIVENEIQAKRITTNGIFVVPDPPNEPGQINTASLAFTGTQFQANQTEIRFYTEGELNNLPPLAITTNAINAVPGNVTECSYEKIGFYTFMTISFNLAAQGVYDFITISGFPNFIKSNYPLLAGADFSTGVCVVQQGDTDIACIYRVFHTGNGVINIRKADNLQFGDLPYAAQASLFVYRST